MGRRGDFHGSRVCDIQNSGTQERSSVVAVGKGAGFEPVGSEVLREMYTGLLLYSSGVLGRDPG